MPTRFADISEEIPNISSNTARFHPGFGVVDIDANKGVKLVGMSFSWPAGSAWIFNKTTLEIFLRTGDEPTQNFEA